MTEQDWTEERLISCVLGVVRGLHFARPQLRGWYDGWLAARRLPGAPVSFAHAMVVTGRGGGLNPARDGDALCLALAALGGPQAVADCFAAAVSAGLFDIGASDPLPVHRRQLAQKMISALGLKRAHATLQRANTEALVDETAFWTDPGNILPGIILGRRRLCRVEALNEMGDRVTGSGFLIGAFDGADQFPRDQGYDRPAAGAGRSADPLRLFRDNRHRRGQGRGVRRGRGLVDRPQRDRAQTGRGLRLGQAGQAARLAARGRWVLGLCCDPADRRAGSATGLVRSGAGNAGRAEWGLDPASSGFGGTHDHRRQGGLWPTAPAAVVSSGDYGAWLLGRAGAGPEWSTGGAALSGARGPDPSARCPSSSRAQRGGPAHRRRRRSGSQGGAGQAGRDPRPQPGGGLSGRAPTGLWPRRLHRRARAAVEGRPPHSARACGIPRGGGGHPPGQKLFGRDPARALCRARTPSYRVSRRRRTGRCLSHGLRYAGQLCPRCGGQPARGTRHHHPGLCQTAGVEVHAAGQRPAGRPHGLDPA
ncbi:hypothetical protein SPOA0204 (plasmid) [Ruegeria pomeroyi DSS-3]|uniref:Uncharacterized protein n=1 Tax=Ruegeria pomeroyi (strain ATCC 700808 / DSM 15171 / DSS-3) TaxID=246200 RepID=Q5LL25_RUEPO|nr:hypothetical protein SPOA0204 [Ruegeria pomeroyi DSS-3]